MKKHLIAAAVAAAVAAPAAFAQSSVEVYGLFDVGYKASQVKTPGGTVKKVEKSGIGYSGFANSRLGFRGTEDLGGGLKAGFVIEGNIDAGSSLEGSNTVSTSNGADYKSSSGFDFGRHSYLTLSGGFGTVLAGKTDSMIKSVFDTFDAGFANNAVGAIDGTSDFTGEGTNLGNQRDATIRYTTPAMSGFTVSAGVTKDSTDTNGVKTKNNDGYELGARYTAGAFSAGLAYRDVTNETASLNEDVKALGLGASYDLGGAQLFAQYFDQEWKPASGAAKDEYKAYAIGVRVPVGAATLFASYNDGEAKAEGVKTDEAGYQLGARYALSKRTSAYAVYGDAERKNASAKDEAYTAHIGIVHQF